MDRKIIDMFIECTLSLDNHKFNKDETFFDYLSSLKKDDLINIMTLYYFYIGDIGKLIILKNKNKNYIVNTLIANLDDITKVIYTILNFNFINGINKLIKNNGYLIFSKDYIELNLHFLEFLKKFKLAKIYYSKRENKIEVFMPEELCKSFKNASKDKSVIKENKKQNSIYEAISCLIDVYGILTIDEFVKLYIKKYGKINQDKLVNVTYTFCMTDNAVNCFSFNNITLLANISFSNEDEAFDFYESCEGQINDNYSVSDYKKIYDGLYFKNTVPYKKFINKLEEDYDIMDDIKFIDDMLVQDYMFSAQLSIETANINFKNNISKLFDDLDEIEKNIYVKMMEDIFKEYPKWKKRGNI
jgi:hypothetical protein